MVMKAIKNVANQLFITIKKHDNIFFLIFMFFAITNVNLYLIITPSDEVWNFQNIYKMCNGYLLYKDANVIVTPLLFIVGEFLFKILGANFLTFRIYNIIIYEALILSIYVLLKKLKLSKKVSLILVLIFTLYENFGIVRCGANYNIMALAIYILGIYLNLKKFKYNNIIQGIIASAIILTKQNYGAFYIIGLFASAMFLGKDIKEKIKNLTIQMITFILIMVVSAGILYKYNILYDFINYTILGIGEFANENTVIDYTGILFIISFALLNLFVTIFFVRNEKVKLNEEENTNLIILNSFAIPMIFAAYPIMNGFHLVVAVLVILILFVYNIKIIVNKSELRLKTDKLTSVILTMLIITTLGFSAYYFWSYLVQVNNDDWSKDSPYYGLIIDEEYKDGIKTMEEYILNNDKRVVILSQRAALYFIPLKISNGELDLPFKGNLGKEGEDGLIEKIKTLENTKILIEKDEENMCWQESKKVREYIMNNLQNTGEIEDFLIYEKQ